MPWSASEAKSKTKSADTPEKRKAWAKIANKALKKYKNEGKAIRVANAAVAKMGSDETTDMLMVMDVLSSLRRKRKVQSRDPFGREAGTWEEEDAVVFDREFSTEQREEAEESGAAMKGGGFPIKNKSDLKNAQRALGRAKNREATIKHIKKRARALGVDLGNWPN